MGGKRKDRKGKARQVAALAYRFGDAGIEVLVMTSRETRRPVIPKGWPMKGLKDCDAAAVEAREEAGVVGDPASKPIGSYEYRKRGADDCRLVEVDVYPLSFESQLDDWKERGQRSFAWMPPSAAAAIVDEPGLSALIEGFSPKPARRPGERDRKGKRRKPHEEGKARAA